MASAVLASGSQSSATVPTAELQEILEYEKILRLRDEVFAGTHPRLKIPAHLTGKLPPRAFQSPSLSAHKHPVADPHQHSVNTATPPRLGNAATTAPGLRSFAEASSAPAPRPASPPKSAISTFNPILLTKSDDLVKAELRIQRERIERSLKEQVEEFRRADAKPKVWGQDAIPDFDVSSVLAQALERVKPAPSPDRPRQSASDSFDENSYYSSQQNESFSDEPEDVPSAPVSHEPMRTGDADNADSPEDSYSPPLETGGISLYGVNQEKGKEPPGLETSRMGAVSQPNQDSASLQDSIQRLTNPYSGNTRGGARTGAGNVFARNDDFVRIQENPSRNAGQGSSQQAPHKELIDLSRRPSPPRSRPSPNVPIIQSQIRSPVAPQPARVSPLAVARMPAVQQGDRLPAENHTNQDQSRESPDVPQQRINPRKRRRGTENNNKHRKVATRRVVDSPEPYIKEEPLSPPPLTAFEPRTSQHSQQSRRVSDIEQTLPRRVASRVDVVEHDRRPPSYRYEQYEPGTPLDGGGFVSYPRDSLVRPERAGETFRRPTGIQQSTRAVSPQYYAVRHSPTEIRPTRATSPTLIGEASMSSPRYIPEEVRPRQSRYVRSERSRSPVYIRDRYSPTNEVSAVMAPPQIPPNRRIAVDADGRRYIAAPSEPTIRHSVAPLARQSMAPPSRHAEPHPYYERVRVPMAVSDKRYDDDGYVERVVPPSRAVSRPVVEHPEVDDYRVYRQRDYIMRPAEYAKPREEYVQTRTEPERRAVSHVNEVPMAREYFPRRESLRPDNSRYEMVSEYDSQLQRARAESVSGGYATTVRREAPARSTHEYGSRVAEQPRQFLPADSDRHMYVVPSPADDHRYRDEVRYLEHPREVARNEYGDEIRRVAYR
ncbi:MAG: hypothetical protein M1833_004772 [Piccolia ochrophora]|nr:MAG: hypothetical protein M1833_004772 [Piccolia ochrophora]